LTGVRPAPLPLRVGERISREQLGALPVLRYQGKLHLVESPADLDCALADIRQEAVLGFDTETRPAFRAGERYLPSLVQFATAGAVYLLQIQLRDYSAALREILSSKRIVKAGVAVADDLRSLREVVEFEPNGVVDLGVIARRHGLKQSGVRNLAGIFLGARIVKGAKTSNWAARRLTPHQLEYAATDAWACRELYLRFQALKLV
jgi:ribonuclease D